MVNIKTFVAHPGSNFTDSSITVNAQQNNTIVDAQSHIPTDTQTKDNNGESQVKTRPIYFAGKKGQKINLYRVILALHECGFFSDGNGGKPRQEDVFAAFGSMLHEDFSDFQKNISAASNINYDTTVIKDLFNLLRISYEDYVNKVINQRKKR